MQEITRPSTSYWKDAMGRIKKDKAAMVFLSILVIIIVMAIVVPIFWPYNMSDMTDHMNKGMFFSDGGVPHIFGTDDLGRDMFARIWHGARISMIIATVAVFANGLLGIIYGGISGYFGGVIDNIMMRIVEIVNGIPYLLIVILLLVVLPRGIMTIILAMMITGWTGMARLVRGQVIQLKEMEYVISAKTLGASAARIILRHMIPNLLSIVIVNLTLAIPSAIFTEAFLSFIGLGVPVPEASWGTLANDGIVNFQRYPLQLILPAFFISITMLSFNMLGDKLRDAFDPKLRR
ncbi:MAG: ABC transporter permease [Bacilli bacterium]|nr:ABC transporter permease [Bacilli bacterium]